MSASHPPSGCRSRIGPQTHRSPIRTSYLLATAADKDFYSYQRCPMTRCPPVDHSTASPCAFASRLLTSLPYWCCFALGHARVAAAPHAPSQLADRALPFPHIYIHPHPHQRPHSPLPRLSPSGSPSTGDSCRRRARRDKSCAATRLTGRVGRCVDDTREVGADAVEVAEHRMRCEVGAGRARADGEVDAVGCEGDRHRRSRARCVGE
ncbi:hypothetical protein B0H16DRAFT_1897341, partial [Mycena metata]